MSESTHSQTIDHRYITVLSDSLLQELITAYLLIASEANTNTSCGAQAAALRIFASFTWGVKRWDDGLLERSRQAAREGQPAMNGHSGGGVEEGRAMLERIVGVLRGDDPLLSRILAECGNFGRGM